MPLTPNNREEHWLKGMVDGSTTLTPNKRQEYWYKEIIDAQGGGGGGGGGVLVVNEVEDGENIRLSETWQTIHDALADGKIVSIPYIDGTAVTSQIVSVAKVINYGAICGIWIFGADLSDTPSYSCGSPTDYPVLP